MAAPIGTPANFGISPLSDCHDRPSITEKYKLRKYNIYISTVFIEIS